jgi:hypothetical protein
LVVSNLKINDLKYSYFNFISVYILKENDWFNKVEVEMTEKSALDMKKEADGDASTSLFKWAPNYDQAATKYE